MVRNVTSFLPASAGEGKYPDRADMIKDLTKKGI